MSANGVSSENVDYATAVQVLCDSDQHVSLLVKRRVLLPPSNDLLKVTLSKNKKKDDFRHCPKTRKKMTLELYMVVDCTSKNLNNRFSFTNNNNTLTKDSTLGIEVRLALFNIPRCMLFSSRELTD